MKRFDRRTRHHEIWFSILLAHTAAGVDVRASSGGDERLPPAITSNTEQSRGSVTSRILPQKYVLDYPVAEEFHPPVRTMWQEVRTGVHRVGRRTFRSPPNAGFGHRMTQQVGGRPLIHVGADLAWFREGEPVYAVANGVVRYSAGPEPDDDDRAQGGGSASLEAPARPAVSGAEPQPAIVAPWGNLVAIEHRLADGGFVTTIYGHLASERLVQTGDLVEAGQPIGTVGRQDARINGGYRPHLHFGIREGRMAEPGRVVMPLHFGGEVVQARLRSVDEDELTLDLSQPPPAGLGDFTLTVGETSLNFRRRGDSYVVPSRLLWEIPTTPEFPLVGYALSTDGFLDPVRFLRRQTPKRTQSNR